MKPAGKAFLIALTVAVFLPGVVVVFASFGATGLVATGLLFVAVLFLVVYSDLFEEEEPAEVVGGEAEVVDETAVEANDPNGE